MTTRNHRLFSDRAKITAFVAVAACGYGIVHDQITVRLCAEYFTLAHPAIFPLRPLTLLALCWGVAATLPIGAVFGATLATASQADAPVPPWPLARVRGTVGALLAVMALAAAGGGVAGWLLARAGVVSVPEAFAWTVPAARHPWFLAVWFAHGASYAVGVVGGGAVCLRVWRARGRPPALALLPRTRAEAARAAAVVAVAAAVFWIRFGRR